MESAGDKEAVQGKVFRESNRAASYQKHGNQRANRRGNATPPVAFMTLTSAIAVVAAKQQQHHRAVNVSSLRTDK